MAIKVFWLAKSPRIGLGYAYEIPMLLRRLKPRFRLPLDWGAAKVRTKPCSHMVDFEGFVAPRLSGVNGPKVYPIKPESLSQVHV